MSTTSPIFLTQVINQVGVVIGINAWQPVRQCAETQWRRPLHNGDSRIAQRLLQRAYVAGAVHPDYDEVLVLKDLYDAPVLQTICHDFDLEEV
ncbi:MAG: hypothetical protein PVH42_09640, partial [Desulfobacterales bacterium]